MSEKVYWNTFYRSDTLPNDCSSFCQYIYQKNLKNPGSRLLDVGCGNGRDSRYFSDKYTVVGIDQASNAIKLNNTRSGLNETYIEGDFTSSDFLTTLGLFDIIYSRFTLHAVSKEDASRFLRISYQILKDGGVLCIEVRSVNSDMYGEGDPDPNGDPDAWILGHYRRFVRINEIETELESIGYNIDYIEEKDGWSIYKGDNPVLIRIIATK